MNQICVINVRKMATKSNYYENYNAYGKCIGKRYNYSCYNDDSDDN
jgi:hypothetical protein